MYAINSTIVAQNAESSDDMITHTPSTNQHVALVSLGEVYTFMGRELEVMDEVSAGNIVGMFD